MLIIANGIYKSGSTWIFLMLLELIGQEDSPDAWRDPNQVRNIDVLNAPEPIFAAADTMDIVSKIHSYERDFLVWLRKHGARVVVTKRDEVDILVSHYHHFSREKLRLPLRFYARTVGLLKALEIVLYERVADDTADVVVDFADLKADPEGTLRVVVEKLGLEYDRVKVAEAASRANMRGRNYQDTFAGMEKREWFFRRDDTSLTRGQRAVLATTKRWAHRLTRQRWARRTLTWLFMLDRRRAKFRDYRARMN